MKKYTANASAMPQNSTAPGVTRRRQAGRWPLWGTSAHTPLPANTAHSSTVPGSSRFAMPAAVSQATAMPSALSGASAACRLHLSVRNAQNKNSTASAAKMQSSSIESPFYTT